jgi:Domain of unknown function (DUF4157)
MKNTVLNKPNKEKPSQSAFFTKGSREPFFGGRDSFFNKPTIQTKLTVNEPGDQFEQEADAVADKVVQRLTTPGVLIKKETTAQAKPLAATITPLIQTKCATCEQEDKLQKKEEDLVHESSTKLQRKPIFESNAEPPPDDKNNIQRKCTECEQEEQIQKKSDSFDSPFASTSIESNLSSVKGSGSPIPEGTIEQMESSFGADFSTVRLHTDNSAVQMNKDLNAQAFTHDSDIYFNEGKYNPESKDGQHLLAHELTHVVQQNTAAFSNSSVQRQVADKIPESKNQFYGHGAFMGAAPQLMADVKWNRILQVLMPDVHVNATKTLSKGPQSDELILLFENNPVMAAYGMYKTRQMDIRRDDDRSDRISKMKAIEWDVFLPTSIVEAYKKAKDDAEKKRLSYEMVSEMLIAHGTPWQTVKENSGFPQYENVKKTPKSEQGGVRPGAWMDLFGRALQLATDSDWEKKAKEYEDPALHPRINSPDDQAAHQTFKNQLGFKEVISLYKRLFGKEMFSVLLDIKSRDATPMILQALVGDLNLRGVHVYGVGSFNHGEIAGLATMTQKVDGKSVAGPKEVKFFHFAGDLQNACLDNKIAKDDTVMFNAGSLISYDSFAGGKKTKASYKIKTDVVNQLRIYKHHYGFHLGVYVQENDIDDRAATLITDLTNRDTDIFDLGFAWGGLSGETAHDIEPSLTHATVGTYNQSWLGEHWDTSKKGPSLLAVASKDVGLISEITYQAAQDFILEKKFEMALNVVVNDLVNNQKMDRALFTIGFVNRMDKGEGLMRPRYQLDPASGNYRSDNPLPITIYTPAFISVQWLVSSVMHEYQHVLQQQRAFSKDEITSRKDGGRLEEVIQEDEVQSYLWEMENAKSTGLINQPGSMRSIFKRLTDHYIALGGYNPEHQAQYTERYEAAKKLVVPQTKEEEELEKCDNKDLPPDYCDKLYEKVRKRYGNKERNVKFDPDKDVNKKRIRKDDPPVVDNFRLIYNRLDSWDIYMRRIHADLYEEFTNTFMLNEKRTKWLSDLKEKTAGYKSDFRNVGNFDIEQTQKDFEEKTLKRIEGEINGLNREIAGWYKAKTDDKADIDTIIEHVHKAGTELWREEWLAIILAVNRILSSLWPPARARIIKWVDEQRKLHPGADLSGNVDNIDYVGSLATGYKGAPKQFARFNVNKFDVDANLDAPPLAKYAITFDHIKPDRKRIFAIAQGTSITPLLDFCYDTHRSLSNVKGFDAKEPFDMVIKAPELPEQKRGREGTERIYKLREKLGEVKYNAMVKELTEAGLLEEAEVGWRLKEELSKDEVKNLNKILKKYES